MNDQIRDTLTGLQRGCGSPESERVGIVAAEIRRLEKKLASLRRTLNDQSDRHGVTVNEWVKRFAEVQAERDAARVTIAFLHNELRRSKHRYALGPVHKEQITLAQPQEPKEAKDGLPN